MFNALNGLGGAGLVAPGPANESNIALYAGFAVVGFFAGFIVNIIGLKPSLFVGAISYVVYAGSFLAYKHIENRGFLIFGGAFLGVCAGPFWASQGAMLISYPSDDQKGRSTSWFWAIYNSGAAIGSLVSNFILQSSQSDSLYKGHSLSRASNKRWQCCFRQYIHYYHCFNVRWCDVVSVSVPTQECQKEGWISRSRHSNSGNRLAKRRDAFL